MAPRSPHSPRIPSSYSWPTEDGAFEKSTPKTPFRRALGLGLLAIVIVLWVASGFLTSSIFATGTYSKPYLITYINTAFFALPLLPVYLKHVYRVRGWSFTSSQTSSNKPAYHHLSGTEPSSEPLFSHLAADDTPHNRSHLSPHDAHNLHQGRRPIDGSPSPPPIRTDIPLPTEAPKDRLDTRATFHLAMKFAPLWFLANWFNSASYSYTSVASSTILVSTSSVFTLLFGVLFKIERFTFKKLMGVLASLAGIMLISLVDTRHQDEGDDADRGTFPYKNPAEIALGDGMALASAMLYGLYATILTRTVGGEADGKVNMPLFFGFIGAISILILWPGLPLLSLIGMESLQAPPSSHAAWVVLANACVSLVSDMCWAYAVLLTSPLVVTVGLALTIPLSLVGQVIINGQYAGWGYWVGAVVIVGGFLVVNFESEKTEPEGAAERAREWHEGDTPRTER